MLYTCVKTWGTFWTCSVNLTGRKEGWWQTVRNDVRWQTGRNDVRWQTVRDDVRWQTGRKDVRWQTGRKDVRWQTGRKDVRWQTGRTDDENSKSCQWGNVEDDKHGEGLTITAWFSFCRNRGICANKWELAYPPVASFWPSQAPVSAISTGKDPTFKSRCVKIIYIYWRRELVVPDTHSWNSCGSQIHHEEIRAKTVEFICRNEKPFSKHVVIDLDNYLDITTPLS